MSSLSPASSPTRGPESVQSSNIPDNVSPSPEQKKVRFAAIDGLRGVACLMVLWLHCWGGSGLNMWPDFHIGSHHFGPWRVFTRGYGGVDLFFVLSGFCLGFPIISRPQRPARWGRYAIARVRRIVPPYWAALFVFGAASIAVRHYNLESVIYLHWPGLRSFVIDGLLFWHRTLVGAFWTLVIEWRWYFLFPLCIYLWRRIGGWGVLAASVVASIISMALKFGLHANWAVSWAEGLFRYLPLFAFGILAAEMASTGGKCACERFIIRYSRWGILLGIAVVLLLGTDIEDRWQNTAQRLATWGPLAFFATLAAVRDPRVQRILSWPPLVRVGIFSYSLYLVQEPFVYSIGSLFQRHVSSRLAIFGLCTVALPIAVIAIAYLFFLAFERPFLSRKTSEPATESMPFARLSDAAVS